jgi:hypothetical protein
MIGASNSLVGQGEQYSWPRKLILEYIMSLGIKNVEEGTNKSIAK